MLNFYFIDNDIEFHVFYLFFLKLLLHNLVLIKIETLFYFIGYILGDKNMKKKLILTTIILITITFISATKVLFIKHETFATPEDNNNLSYNLMKNIMEKLNIDFQYEYVEHLEAMQAIDDQENVVIFPYFRPRNMSVRILLSDTLYVSTQKIFYNSRLYGHVEVNALQDLRSYIVGSYPRHPNEIDFRRAGLTVHYSPNNQESMQKLTNQNLAFVIEEPILGNRYLQNTEGMHKDYIKIHDIDLFPIPIFAIAPVANKDAAEVIERINNLIKQGIP